jgi:hypothetical protein
MRSSRKTADPVPRTVEVCERYLDRLALVVQRAGTNGGTFVPLVRRLERELAEAKEEEEVLERLRHRLTKSPSRPGSS